MPKEDQFPTMRFMKCNKCGNVFVSSPGGPSECPECSSSATSEYTPEAQDEKKSDQQNEKND